MIKEHYTDLFNYEAWATGRVLDAMKQLPAQDEKCLEWMAHILLAQLLWYARLVKNGEIHAPWEKKTLEECVQIFERNTKLWNEYCNKLSEEDFNKKISYKNTKGEPYENTIKDILTHVINHSTYHRGQIIAQLKGKLPALPATDFIVYRR